METRVDEERENEDSIFKLVINICLFSLIFLVDQRETTRNSLKMNFLLSRKQDLFIFEEHDWHLSLAIVHRTLSFRSKPILHRFSSQIDFRSVEYSLLYFSSLGTSIRRSDIRRTSLIIEHEFRAKCKFFFHRLSLLDVRRRRWLIEIFLFRRWSIRCRSRNAKLSLRQVSTEVFH